MSFHVYHDDKPSADLQWTHDTHSSAFACENAAIYFAILMVFPKTATSLGPSWQVFQPAFDDFALADLTGFSEFPRNRQSEISTVDDNCRLRFAEDD